MSSVQALMDLALPRFAMAERPRQVHPPWPVTSESPASPAIIQTETRGREDSRCLMDQTLLSPVYLNLDALSSSSDEETLDVKKCEDFAITFVCNSEGTGTRVNSDEVISVPSGVWSKGHSTGCPAARQTAGRSDQEDSSVS